ncbi:MAG: LuxR C-terminal-related transcriptional regulator [Nocardioides sp.]
MNCTLQLPDADPYGRPELLTKRERQVMTMIASGYSNAEIGQMLYLSINSVKTYVRSGYRKAGVITRAQAVLWGIRHGLVDLDALFETEGAVKAGVAA